MFGTFIAGHCSDWFGRRRTILAGILATAASGAWAAFSPTFIIYTVARVTLAFGVSAFRDVTDALVMETVSPRFRYLPTISLGIGWSLGMLALPGVAYIAKDWQALQLYACVPLGVMFLVWIFLPESPRWQLANGEYDAARKNLMRLAKCNNSPKESVEEVIENAREKAGKAQETRKGFFIDLFSTKRRALTTSVFSFQLAVSSMAWYYMTVSTAAVGTNPYISFAVAAASELPVKLINALLIRFCRRRLALLGSFFLIMLVMIALIILPRGYPWVKLALLIVGKMCTSANGVIIRVHVSEVYPTIVRSVALGVCITIGRVGTVVSPFLDDLGLITFPWMSKAITSALCLSCALATRLTRETFQKALQDNFDTNQQEEATTASPPAMG
ncbi:organic anion transporter 3-like isoform X2 [Ornithodoros turicata]|uniref:organic anion transporter 3-like isoform X2 n=1 Tax=Ornithodoros turicata TaxID=34597 RepID=UPI003139EDB8